MADPVDEARRLLAEATPGPWEAVTSGPREWLIEAGRETHRGSPIHHARVLSTVADAALIAAAPTLLAALCDEVERLRAVRDAAREVLAVVEYGQCSLCGASDSGEHASDCPARDLRAALAKEGVDGGQLSP